MYGPAADSIANSAPGDLVGPVPVEGYYLLAKVRDLRPAGLPESEALRPRLRQGWMQAHSGQLRRAWVLRLQETAYPVYIDTSLLLHPVPVGDSMPLSTAWPDSATLAPDSAANRQLALPDSALVDTFSVIQLDSVQVDSLPTAVLDSVSGKTNPPLPD